MKELKQQISNRTFQDHKLRPASAGPVFLWPLPNAYFFVSARLLVLLTMITPRMIIRPENS